MSFERSITGTREYGETDDGSKINLDPAVCKTLEECAQPIRSATFAEKEKRAPLFTVTFMRPC